MSDLRCPRCGDSFRIPSVDLPSGPPTSELSARCPWCAEIIPLTQLLTALPPVAQLIGDDGQPLAVAASGGEGENPFTLQPAGLPVAASAADAGAFTEEGIAGEEAFGGAEDFSGDSFDFAAEDAIGRDADGDSYLGEDRYLGDDQDADAGERYEEFAGGGSGFAESSMEADEFEESEHAGPVDPRPIEEVSGASFSPDGHLVTPRARVKKKSSSLRSILGVVVGGLLALPLAAGILALLGKPLDLGFWPFDGQTIATGGAARTAAPVLPLSDEARPARAPQPGRSLAEDMPRGELMTMDPAEEPSLPSDEQPSATGPGNPWEFPQSPGRASMTGPEMVTPQVAEEVEPEAAVADAPAFDPFAADPFAAEPFAADSRGGDVAVPGVADPGTAAPDDFAANMNRDPFAPLEQPIVPLDSEPAETDPPASPANDFSLDDPLLTLPANAAPAEPADAAPEDAGEAPDAPEMSQQAVAPGAVAAEAAAELGQGESPAPEADAEPPTTEPPTTEPPTTEPPSTETATTETATTATPAPLAPAEEASEVATAQPNAEEDIAVTPAGPAPTADAVAENASAAEGAGQSQPVASAAGQPAEAAAPERSASSPQFAAAQAAAESALQAIRDYDLAAGVAGLRPHLAKLYEHVAALGELAEPQDAPALAALTEQILEINVLKDLAPAAPNWIKYSRRPNDGMLAVGPLRQEADAWLLDWSGPTPLELRFSQGDAEVQPQAKVLVLGRILSSEPSAPAIEATFLQSLD